MIEVMIIEDDPMVREINTKFLKKVEGFSLYKAVGNLSDARKHVLARKPDLILLDVFLPKENGIDFLKWLRSEEIAVDVILITADKTASRVQEAFRYGAVDYLIKPFSFERFREALLQFKELQREFKRIGEIDQAALDKLISSTPSVQEDEGLAKGLNKYTYKSILDEIDTRGAEYFTADELSEKLRIARVTVRRYLEHMEKDGLLEKLVEYGRVGRPQHKFKKI